MVAGAEQTPARVTVQTPDGRVILLSRRAPLGASNWIRGRTLAVVPVPPSAPPGAALTGSAPTGVAPEWLVAALGGCPAPVLAARAGPEERPALAVVGLDERAAVRLGRALGLDVVFYWDGRRARLVACR